MAESGTWQEFCHIWKERRAFVELCVIWWMKPGYEIRSDTQVATLATN